MPIPEQINQTLKHKQPPTVMQTWSALLGQQLPTFIYPKDVAAKTVAGMQHQIKRL